VCPQMRPLGIFFPDRRALTKLHHFSPIATTDGALVILYLGLANRSKVGPWGAVALTIPFGLQKDKCTGFFEIGRGAWLATQC